jgi:simple sugar transport system ATP-binding protein
MHRERPIPQPELNTLHRQCMTENVLEYMLQLKQDGVSCVFVTHNLYHAYRVCDRFVILSRGRMVRDVAKSATSIEELTTAIVKE